MLFLQPQTQTGGVDVINLVHTGTTWGAEAGVLRKRRLPGSVFWESQDAGRSVSAKEKKEKEDNSTVTAFLFDSRL